MSNIFLRSVCTAAVVVGAHAFGAFHNDDASTEACPQVMSDIVKDQDLLRELAREAGITDFMENIRTIKPIGTHTALIAEASDAGGRTYLIKDGMSGDLDFPHGNLKVLATVGEVNDKGEFFVGVPDGQGAYLIDDDTVRVIVQSESYGPVAQFEAFPWKVNEDTLAGEAATLTGSHVQYLDVDRSKLATFMEHDGSAADMIVEMGTLAKTFYNLKGELVGPRNRDGPTTTGAHISNCDADGNYVTKYEPEEADWVMQSLCSAHLEVKHQWGEGVGFEDSVFITNEEWAKLKVEDCEHGEPANFTGLPAHVIDLENDVMYALGIFTLGGFEKIVEFSSGSTKYIALAVSGYNGNFGDGSKDFLTDLRNQYYGNRADGMPYVYTQDVVPNRIYIGKKGFNMAGEPADDFLSRNGLAHGKLYGFAVDTETVAWRDTFHKGAKNGATVDGAFYPVDWVWDGEVRNFEHDGSWSFQDHPVGAPEGTEFWTGLGPDKAAKKTEHVSPNPMGESGFFQSSTAGYIGHYLMESLGELLQGDELPTSIPATYKVLVGETDVNEDIVLAGKGKTANGNDQTTMTDKDKEHTTFEDIDGIEVFAAADGMWCMIHEDGGNIYGERALIGKVAFDGEPVQWRFIAQYGGVENTRNKMGVGVPAGVNAGGSEAKAHEFSGATDLSGFLARADGRFIVGAAHAGYHHRQAAKDVAINDKLITISLQAHNYNMGVISTFRVDRGGQVYVYKPSV